MSGRVAIRGLVGRTALAVALVCAIAGCGRAEESWDSLDESGRQALADGRFDEASERLERALARAEEFGEDDPRLVRSLNDLGLCYTGMGQLDRAVELYRRAIDIRSRRLPPGDPQLIESWSNLGMHLQSAGRLDEAADAFGHALEAASDAGSESSPGAITALHNLGTIALLAGRYDDAEGYYDRCLDAMDESLIADPPQLAMTLNNLGQIRSATGDLPGAESYFGRAIEVWTRNTGPQSDPVARTRRNLADVLRRLDRPDEARRQLDMALAVFEDDPERNAGELAMTLNLVALIDRDAGRNADAESAYRRAESLLAAGAPSTELGVVHFNLARVLLVEGRRDEAATEIDASVEAYRGAPGGGPAQAASVLRLWAEALRREGLDDDAAAAEARADTLAGSG